MREFFISLKKFGEDIADLFKPKNRVRIIIREGDDGEVVRVIEGRNVVTGFITSNANKSGRDFMRRLIINPSNSNSFNGDYYINKMALGRDGTVEAYDDTGLIDKISGSDSTIHATNGVLTLSTSLTEVTFSASWDTNTANGETIKEIGLYSNTHNGATHFLARKTFTPFTKTADFSFTIEWTLRF